ncbi:IS110 family transposase [Hugenholtzia roseola]|uniref:IS110 family transposase n=1 Tax=Hugenholtzia roseola TaxID=1002 RepID=UPI000427F2F6|nr:IS110 family transposase [Hugenholtzia roseola]
MFWIGLDISKEKIDYAFPNPKNMGHYLRTGRINNNLKGYANLERIILESGINFNLACETTGIYSFPIMDYFSSRGYHCNEIHAFSIASYKKTVLQRNKTDKVDAKEISDYAHRYKDKLVRPYVARTANLIELGLLIRTKKQLEKRDRALNNILEAYGFVQDKLENITFEYADKGLRSLISNNQAYKKNFDKGISQYCKENFAATYEALNSISGVGENTIPYLIYYTNNFTRFNNPRDFTSYIGVVPNFYESGSSVKYKTRIAHKSVCNSQLRAALSQAANIAMRHNPQIKELVSRLDHLTFKQRLIAATRKLAIQVYFCGKNKVMYDKNRP